MLTMKRLQLTNGGFTLLDDEDYNYFSQWKWQNIHGYAVRCVYVANRKLGKGVHRSVNKLVALHREVNKTPEGFDTDHVNRDKLDNRKSNLRTTNRSVNAHNAGKKNNNSRSSLQGVQWRSDRKKWRSYICIDYKPVYLGTFDDELDAHLIYISAKEQLT